MNSPLLQSELIYICKLHGYRYNELPYMIGVSYSIIQELVYHGTYNRIVDDWAALQPKENELNDEWITPDLHDTLGISKYRLKHKRLLHEDIEKIIEYEKSRTSTSCT